MLGTLGGIIMGSFAIRGCAGAIPKDAAGAVPGAGGASRNGLAALPGVAGRGGGTAGAAAAGAPAAVPAGVVNVLVFGSYTRTGAGPPGGPVPVGAACPPEMAWICASISLKAFRASL